ncbi:helix-turn-helix domain-containing protein [Maribacter sp. PR1]|uniref:Helix-turn-helix domain-containing protein n=1 Tax=Maribacter cobaltidurans TaxID=1178778 RepID=A0ABU7IU36_9FLAO|nr:MULTISPECIES: helix-turn-helix domain-containing protein [Maribacter]MDC6389103.1 helix-turn-helix domain-containing protein [Maribacter sp. PR1]MEE1976490.1 helix-turn-helix domain-containing protein [Maribacter cobaltidurans]
MSNSSTNTASFIEQAEALILQQLGNEQFGVSELADAMHMSRSNLLRKIKKQTKLSASQFIRQVRLKEAMAQLKEGSSTVSEISYQVGFGSTSYFIKCFREQYGYPPGEVGKDMVVETEKVRTNFFERYRWPLIATMSLALILVAAVLFNKKDEINEPKIEKSIAVLPFKNESSDSTNLYFVNGLMEAALYNLQKIEDMRVISRTSVEKYRKTDKGIPEIAEELNVSYLVEGSGQRVGNQVLLNIQLIEASTDTPIWVEQYNQEVVDIFALQNDVAKKIANAIQALVTPSELEQIEKKPTENLLAYDYYLKALDPYYRNTKEGLEEAIPLFEKAVEYDPQFALAYANLAISYYHLDIHQRQKQYTNLINNYSDKALLYDSKNDVSLISRALYYMHTEEYRLALPHLEKALEYNPNSADVVQVLSLLYNSYIPDTAKYLKYALMGVQLNISANDSVGKGYIYLTLSNALAQTGFINEALEYINKSLEYDPTNAYAPYLKTYIEYAENGDMEQAKTALIKELEKDSTRLDILQEVAKLHYFQEDYDGAYIYYKRFTEIRDKRGLNIYPQEDAKIALVYEKMGLKEQAAHFFRVYSEYCENDESLYKSASMALRYAYEGKINAGIEQLKAFALQDHFQYWILLFLEKDPLIKPLQKHPEYEETIQRIKDRFWDNQEKLRTNLKKEGLL